MATFNKFNSFIEAMGRKVHNLNADTLKVCLTNTAPVATNTVFADLTEITAQNGYTAGGTAAGTNSYAQTLGVAKLLVADVVFTASAGGFGPFRYATLYNFTATNKELIGYYDYSASITLLNAGETFTVDFDGTNGVFTNT